MKATSVTIVTEAIETARKSLETLGKTETIHMTALRIWRKYGGELLSVKFKLLI